MQKFREAYPRLTRSYAYRPSGAILFGIACCAGAMAVVVAVALTATI